MTSKDNNTILVQLINTMNSLVESQKQVKIELHQINETLNKISGQITLINDKLNDFSAPPDSAKNNIDSTLYPVEIFNLPEALRETLTTLTNIFLEKKRPVAVIEIKQVLVNLGHHTILSHLRQLRSFNERSWVKPPVTRRFLNEKLKELEKRGNPDKVDLNLPITSGKAYFWEPISSITKFINYMQE